MPAPKTVCVAGASGLVGSNIVRAALGRGYAVRGTLRDKDDPRKAPYLMALPHAAERLTLFSADMAQPGAFDEAVSGTDWVFIASLIPPMRAPPASRPGRWTMPRVMRRSSPPRRPAA